MASINNIFRTHADIPAHVANYIVEHADVASPEQLSIEFINAWFDDANWEGEDFDNPTNYDS